MDIYRKGPSHTLGFVRYTSNGDPEGRFSSFKEVCSPFGPDGRFCGNFMRRLAVSLDTNISASSESFLFPSWHDVAVVLAGLRYIPNTSNMGHIMSSTIVEFKEYTEICRQSPSLSSYQRVFVPA